MAAFLLLFACKPKAEPETTPSGDPTELSKDPSAGPEASEDPSVDVSTDAEVSEDPSEDDKPKMKVTVTTVSAEALNLYYALFNGKYSIENAPDDLGTVEPYFSFSSTYKTADEIIDKGTLMTGYDNGDGSFDCETDGFDPGAKFNYVAWVKIGDDIYKGSVKVLTMKDYVDYAQPVDLGLSVKWCNVNIGAMNPEDKEFVSLFFLFGEIETKSLFSRGNYAFTIPDPDDPDNIKGFTDYTGEDGKDKKKKLNLSDDAAYKLLGRDWKMPTKENYEEMVEKCTFEYLSDIKCWKVTGPSGRYLYFPALGLNDSFFGGYINKGLSLYWSSTYSYGDYSLACCLALNTTYQKPNYTWRVDDAMDRYTGCPIRAVYRGDN